MKKLLSMFLIIVIALSEIHSQTKIIVHVDQPGNQINKEIYGQFAEHLGSCIYGGIWVGENSPIPNTKGYRNDVLNALKELQIPVLRWPGGCFADEYHWMDGIGPCCAHKIRSLIVVSVRCFILEVAMTKHSKA